MPLTDRFALSTRVAVAAGLLLLAFSVGYAVLAWRTVKQEQVERLQTVLEIVQKATSAYFAEFDVALQVLAREVQADPEHRDPERTVALLRRFKELRPDITALNLLDLEGGVVATASAPARAALPPLTHVRSPSFAEFLARLGPATRTDLGRPLQGRIDTGWYFPIRHVLRDGQGRPTGVLSATLPVEVLQRFWSDAPVVSSAAIGLVRDDGYLISLYPRPAGGDLATIYGQPRVSAALLDGIAGRTRYAEGHSGVLPELGAYVFTRLTNYPVTMFVVTPMANYWLQWWSTVRVPYALLALLAVAGALGLRALRAHERALEAEQQRTEDALAEKRLAEQANQTKSEFMARMSHELRTPLHAILGFAQLLQRDATGTLRPDQQRDLTHVLHAGHHLLSLIDDLLDLSRVEAGTLRIETADVDASDVVRDAMHQVAVQAGARDIAIALDAGPAPLPAVRADPTRLRQVVLNLLSNAVKYNRPGGRVTVRLRALDGRLHLTVSDTGPGLTPPQIGRLFQPFDRLGREGSATPGTGIGLVIARSLVELMGGSLTVASEPGVGSEFRVDLPLSAQPASAAEAGRASRPVRHAPAEGSVIYVDDDEINRLLVQAYLSVRPGVSLRLAASAPEGLALAHESRPDLLLIDLMMPGMNGLQLLAAVRREPALNGVPCIALSANAMPEEIDAAMRAGFDGYLVKPVSADTLLAELDRRLAPQPSPA